MNVKQKTTRAFLLVPDGLLQPDGKPEGFPDGRREAAVPQRKGQYDLQC